MHRTDVQYFLKHTVVPTGLSAFSGYALNIASPVCGAMYGFTQHVSEFFLNRMINRFIAHKYKDERILKAGVPTARFFAMVISIQIGARASKSLECGLGMKNAFYIYLLVDTITSLGTVTLKSSIANKALQFFASTEFRWIQERRRYL